MSPGLTLRWLARRGRSNIAIGDARLLDAGERIGLVS